MISEENLEKIKKMSNEELASSELWKELSLSDKFSFFWLYKKWVIFGAIVLLLAAPFALNDLISKFSNSELKVTSTAETKELEKTEINCKKVNGVSTNAKLEIAEAFNVSLKTVSFLQARWDFDAYGSKSCIFLFDTAVGPKKCRPLHLVTSDDGKTAFGFLFNNLTCFQ
jgi:hypothetical protein